MSKVCLLLGMQYGSRFCNFVSDFTMCLQHRCSVQVLMSLLRAVFESCSAILSVASAVGVSVLWFVPRAGLCAGSILFKN